MKYKSIKEYKIIPKDTVLEPNDKGEYIFELEDDGIVTTMTLTKDMLNNEEFFELQNPIKITISEEDLDSVTKKNWKLVFNLKCTEKQLLEVKKFIENGVSDLI